MRIPSIPVLCAIACGAAALAVREPDAARSLERTRQHIQQAVNQAHTGLVQRTRELGAALLELGPEQWMRTQAEALEAERARTGAVYLALEGDSTICWSGAPAARAAELNRARGAHARFQDGIWLHAVAKHGSLRMHGYRLLWRTPPIENRWLRQGFHASFGAPAGLRLSEGRSPAEPLRDGDGEEMLSIVWEEDAPRSGAWLLARVMLLLLAFAFLLAALWRSARKLVGSAGPFAAIIVFLAGAGALRAGLLLAEGPLGFSRLPLFDPAIYAASLLFPSLGDLLINAVVLAVAGSFVALVSHGTASAPPSAGGALLRWSMVLAHAAWTTSILIGMVEDSNVELDMARFTALGPYSAAALGALVLLFVSWSAAAYAWLAGIAACDRVRRWATGAAALAVSAAVHHLLGVRDTAVFLWPVPLAVVIVRLHRSGMRFAPAVIGVALLAAFAAHLLIRHTDLRELRDRRALAERLATREDPVVEQLFRETAPRLRADPTVYAMLTGSGPCDPASLDREVRQRFFSGYWERYEVRLFAFSTDGRVRCATDAEPPRGFSDARDVFTDPTAAMDMPDLFMDEQPGRGSYYHARVAVMPVDTLPPGQLIVELHPRPTVQVAGFPALLLAGDDPVAQRAERYSIARYQGGHLIERSGPYPYPMRLTDAADGPEDRHFREGGFDHWAHGSSAGTRIVLGVPDAGLKARITTFSSLFALFGLVLAVAWGMRTIVRTKGLPALGIGAKVRVTLIVFALLALGAMGFGAQRLLSRQYDQRFDAALLEKARSVHQELLQKFDGEPPLNASHAAYLEHLLVRWSNVFFTDITVFALDGRPLASSRPQMFTTGLLPRRMSATAWVSLAIEGRSAHVQEEAIGEASYRAAYLPLSDRRGRVLAYVALPGFADQSQREAERSGVVVAAINLFVPFFTLGILLAVLVSQWTVRPMDLLRNALARIELRGANEPLRYRGDDEIGRLVEVYNRKVEELRASAEKLARTERESAWREMARQVAHEIKNPLTPMKLGIQQFRRTWDPHAPDAQERLDRFAAGMVEQIDALSAVASAFSQFAQMPAAVPIELDLCDVVRAAVEVFHASPGITVSHHEEGPLPVLADREHMLRVFNNLLKNAVQAIPADHEGRIDVRAWKEAGQAVVEVRDNGAGIPTEVHSRIFTPSFTTKSSGMGLGLALVKRMVEQAGGRVWFESNAGMGTRFVVELPLHRQADTFGPGSNDRPIG